MYEAFMGHVMRSTVHDLPVLLDSEWNDIVRWSDAVRWVPRTSRVDILGHGPDPVPRGRPFNVQPGGGSAIWVATSRRPAPDSRLRLGGTVLETVVQGTLLTALVPLELTAESGELELRVVGPDGADRSQCVHLNVLADAGC